MMRFRNRGTIRNWLVKPATGIDSGPLAHVVARSEAVEANASVGALQALRVRAREEDWQAESDPEFLSLIRTVFREELGIQLHPVQLVAALGMLRGHAVELATGEGKTFAGAIAAIGFALGDERVTVLTANDYLAERDAVWLAPIMARFGLSCGAITEGTDPLARRSIYRCDVVYITVSELGFDLLRDRRVGTVEDRIQPALRVCLVDEIDAVLIDDALTPLVLAGPGTAEDEIALADLFRVADGFVRGLDHDLDITIDPDRRNAALTDRGLERAAARWPRAQLFGVDSRILVAINLALHAHFLVSAGVDYVVRDVGLGLVDDTRGRIAELRRWSAGLHSAVEVREGFAPSRLGTIHDQVLVRTILESCAVLAGMSATVEPVADYLRDAYHLDSLILAPHSPLSRVDHPARIFRTGIERDAAAVNEVLRLHARANPVLVATGDVNASVRFAEYLRDAGLSPRVLNAQNDAEEAALIAETGHAGVVTVSTQMSGRGVDIRLDERARSAGGLAVIALGYFPSLRQDAQLRGRAGRQGDPGESVTLVALDDEQIVRADLPDRERKLAAFAASAGPTGLIESPAAARYLERGQRAIEAARDTIRDNGWRYGRALDQQRTDLLKLRENVLTDEGAHAALVEADADAFSTLSRALGAAAAIQGGRDLMLFRMDQAWTEHLEGAQDLRDGILYRALGRQTPLTEYLRELYTEFELLPSRIREALAEDLRTAAAQGSFGGLTGRGVAPGTTWTYLVNDDPFGSTEERFLRWLGRRIVPAQSDQHKGPARSGV